MELKLSTYRQLLPKGNIDIYISYWLYSLEDILF